MRFAAAVVVIGAAVALLPVGAAAAPSAVAVDDSHGFPSLRVSALDDPAPHEIAVTRSGGVFDDVPVIVTDTAGVAAGGGCTALGPTSASCDLGAVPVFDGEVNVQGGRGDDSVDLNALEGETLYIVVEGNRGDDSLVGSQEFDYLFGGPGNDDIRGKSTQDLLVGQKGDDLIVGGRGPDDMFGGSGIDRLIARDSNAELRIWCGRGDDRRERASVDRKDPRPRSC